MTGAAGTDGGPVRRPVAVALAGVAFVASTIAGLGLTSLALDEDVISLPGGGQIPGIVGMIVAAAAFAGSLAVALRPPHPSFWSAPIVAIAVCLFYSGGVSVGAGIAGVDPAAALAASGRALVSWFGVVVAAAAAVSAWGGIALVRTRARRPRWGWEGDDDE